MSCIGDLLLVHLMTDMRWSPTSVRPSFIRCLSRDLSRGARYIDM